MDGLSYEDSCPNYGLRGGPGVFQTIEFGYLLFFFNEAILINDRRDEIEFGYQLCCIGTIV